MGDIEESGAFVLNDFDFVPVGAYVLLGSKPVRSDDFEQCMAIIVRNTLTGKGMVCHLEEWQYNPVRFAKGRAKPTYTSDGNDGTGANDRKPTEFEQEKVGVRDMVQVCQKKCGLQASAEWQVCTIQSGKDDYIKMHPKPEEADPLDDLAALVPRDRWQEHRVNGADYFDIGYNAGTIQIAKK